MFRLDEQLIRLVGWETAHVPSYDSICCNTWVIHISGRRVSPTAMRERYGVFAVPLLIIYRLMANPQADAADAAIPLQIKVNTKRANNDYLSVNI